MGIAQNIAAHHSERDILESYLNIIRFGAHEGKPVIGIEGGSQLFFGKSVNELNTGEQLLLISAVPQPETYQEQESLGTLRHVALNNLALLIDRGEITEDEKVSEVAMQIFTAEFTLELESNVEEAQNRALGSLNTYLQKEGISKSIYQAIERKKSDIHKSIETWQGTRIGNRFMKSNLSSPYFQSLRGPTEEVFLSPFSELPNNPNVRIENNRIILLVDAEEYRRERLHYEEPTFELAVANPFDAELAHIINTHMSRNGNHFEFQTDKPSPLFIPAFEIPNPSGETEMRPGLAISIVGTNGEVLASYDGSNASLSRTVEVGSAGKQFVLALGMMHDIIESVNSPTNDFPGQYRLIYTDKPVINATPPLGNMEFGEALRWSRNVPFQKILYEMWPDTETEKQNVLNQIQEFYGKFGIQLAGIDGKPITDPNDPALDIFSLGTDSYFVSTDPSISNQEAFARANLILHNPRAFFNETTDADLIGICEEISALMNNDAYIYGTDGHRAFWGPGVRDLLDSTLIPGQSEITAAVKTGTVASFIKQGNQKSQLQYTVHTVTTAMVAQDQGDNYISVFVNASGQEIDTHGNPTRVGLPESADAGSKLPAPIATFLAESFSNIDQPSKTNPASVREHIHAVLTENSTILTDSYRVAVTNQTPIYGAEGIQIGTLPHGSTVDIIGEVKDGMQQVAYVHRGEGSYRQIRTGFIHPETYTPVDGSESLSHSYLQLIEHSLEDISFPNNEAPTFLITSSEDTSPTLNALAQMLETNHLLFGTMADFPGLYNQLGLEDNVIIINYERLQDFIPNDLRNRIQEDLSQGKQINNSKFQDYGQVELALLQKELLQAVRLNTFASQYNLEFSEELNESFNNLNSPARRMLSLLTYYMDNYEESDVLQEVVIKYESADPEDVATQEQYQLMYDTLNAWKDYQTNSTPENLKTFVDLLHDLNNLIPEDLKPNEIDKRTLELLRILTPEELKNEIAIRSAIENRSSSGRLPPSYE